MVAATIHLVAVNTHLRLAAREGIIWVVKGWCEVHVVFPDGRASRSELSCQSYELQSVLINVKVHSLCTSQNVLLASSQGKVMR